MGRNTARIVYIYSEPSIVGLVVPLSSSWEASGGSRNPASLLAVPPSIAAGAFVTFSRTVFLCCSRQSGMIVTSIGSGIEAEECTVQCRQYVAKR